MIKKSGFEIIEGEEGKYDRLVKLTENFIIEIVYFPRKRSGSLNRQLVAEATQKIAVQTYNSMFPSDEAPNDRKRTRKRFFNKFLIAENKAKWAEEKKLPPAYEEKIEDFMLSFYVTLKLNKIRLISQTRKIKQWSSNAIQMDHPFLSKKSSLFPKKDSNTLMNRY